MEAIRAYIDNQLRWNDLDIDTLEKSEGSLESLIDSFCIKMCLHSGSPLSSIWQNWNDVIEPTRAYNDNPVHWNDMDIDTL